MNKYFTIILCAFSFTYSSLVASKYQNSTNGIECAHQLQKWLNAIQKIPGANDLLAGIRSEGPIRIRINNTDLSHQFGAYWDPDERTICVAVSQGVTDGSIIGSILFELHNAQVNSKLDQLSRLAIRGEISKDQYIESMERLEYINSINASKMAKTGIEMGVLPADAHLPTYSNFKEHFKMQKKKWALRMLCSKLRQYAG
jgi:hypothetical protein